MSDIFISYAKEDRERARMLAAALKEMGWSVWWDRIIPTGEVFDEVIQEELDSAKCVIVLWSSTSVKSRWVKAEAERAFEQEKLFPILIERVPIPMAFSRFQAADLVDWDGDSTGAEFPQLVEDLGRILRVRPPQAEDAEAQSEVEPPPTTESVPPAETRESRSAVAAFLTKHRFAALGVVAALIVVAAWGLYRLSPAAPAETPVEKYTVRVTLDKFRVSQVSAGKNIDMNVFRVNAEAFNRLPEKGSPVRLTPSPSHSGSASWNIFEWVRNNPVSWVKMKVEDEWPRRDMQSKDSIDIEYDNTGTHGIWEHDTLQLFAQVRDEDVWPNKDDWGKGNSPLLSGDSILGEHRFEVRGAHFSLMVIVTAKRVPVS